MSVKGRLKQMIGRAASIDWYEKLSEYAILEQAEILRLDGARQVQVDSKLPAGPARWHEIYDGSRFRIWEEALNLVGGDILLLEFGVFQGASMRKFLELNTAPASVFYGFDSFEGLPEEWRNTAPGHFSVDGNIPDIVMRGSDL